jgi:hypothetical protein
MKSGDRVIARARVIGRAQSVFTLLGNALHEIFDESAYERFLQRTSMARTRQSYRAFLLERESSDISKPRCC